jgi:putative methyltransferase (TIGR04325 family)
LLPRANLIAIIGISLQEGYCLILVASGGVVSMKNIDQFWSSNAYVQHLLSSLESQQLTLENSRNRFERKLFGRQLITTKKISDFWSAINEVTYSDAPFIRIVTKLLSNKVNTVLDIGGGGGENYMAIRPYLSSKHSLDWIIIDNAKLWDLTKKSRSRYLGNWGRDSLSRLENLNQKNLAPDLLLLNGVLQYLPSVEWLMNSKNVRAKSIVINRTVLSFDKTKNVRQKVVIGTGELKQKFFLFNTVYNEVQLTNFFSGKGYGTFINSKPFQYELTTDKGLLKGYYRTMSFIDSTNTH